jgi:Protein of unknown function (DUF2950)/Protein of unknown function (DUF3300)
VAIRLAAAFILAGLPFVRGAGAQAPSQPAASARIPPDQLDSLVAPIALYPDPLLAQVLVASTYPIEIVQLQQWLTRNPGLKDPALADAVMKEPWDPSIQALAGLPEAVKRLADDVRWTTGLGNAFLAQQKDVMDAIQRMRAKARASGHLTSTEQQVVTTKVIETQQVIVIEQPNPQVVYVPSYDPVVIWGPPVYPYPAIHYPPYYDPGTPAIRFGIGVPVGAWRGGTWGWGCGWGSSQIIINNNSDFIRPGDVNRADRGGNLGDRGGGNWQHNPDHRGGTPYRDRATADRFGGTTRGDSFAKSAAREHLGHQGDEADRFAGNRSAFAGGSQGFNGARSNASSTRGAASMGSRGDGAARAGGAPGTAATPATATAAAEGPETFDTPEQAADALVEAAERFDVPALARIFGAQRDDLVLTGEFAQDREWAREFAAHAEDKKIVSLSPKTGTRASLLVGNQAWPFPAPILKSGGKWSFDAAAGRQELIHRRIGSNELDAIEICRGFVEAQYEYAFHPRQGYDVNQYAQRIVSTPGKQDGLAWQNPDGSWAGPVAERIARAIEQGYSINGEPYHGYFFKVLKGQGPDAPHGALDYVVKGVMIGGFALAAAPAEYRQTGVRTFMVSQDGVVYEKDLGPDTLEHFEAMQMFNPDKSWRPVAY